MTAKGFPGALALVLLLAGCRTVEAGKAGEAGTVRRGELTERLLLTGALEAEAGVAINVPRTPNWRVEIRYIAKDGSTVAAGDRVVELDNSSFVSDLEEKRLGVVESQSQLSQRGAQLKVELSDAALEVERRESDLVKARLDADVPDDLLARREYEQRQLALRQAEVALAKAKDQLTAKQEASRAELGKLELELAGRRTELATAEAAIRSLSITSPVAGTVVVADHPWLSRKLRDGDQAWVGMTILRIPDLARTSVVAQLSDVDAGRVEVGQAVTCVVDAYPDRPFQGRVSEVTPIAREEPGESLRSFFRVAIEPAPGGIDPERMRPGMSVRVEVAKPIASGLLAPRAGLLLEGDTPRARLADGRVVELRLAGCDARDCVVEGLEEGARLRLEGAP